MDKDIIKISKKNIADLISESGKILFKKSAEDELLKLLLIKDEIDTALASVKEMIMKAGKEVSPDFNGVIGKRIKCVVRKYGDRYKSTNPDFIKEIVIKRTDGDKVDEYVENKGKLPEGVMENIREEKLTIIVPKENDTTIGQISS